MPEPVVSTIMTLYNRATYVRDAARRLLAQSLTLCPDHRSLPKYYITIKR